jgi:hypothetical protein
MSAYDDWAAGVVKRGGEASVWPVSDSDAGKPAAKYSEVAYKTLANSGALDLKAKSHQGASTFWYVLAPTDVAADQQGKAGYHKQTKTEALENTVFTKADEKAKDWGLPSLGSIDHALKLAGVALLLLAIGGVVLHFYPVSSWGKKK